MKDLYSKKIALGLIRKVCREYGFECCMPKGDATNKTTSNEVNSKGGNHER